MNLCHFRGSGNIPFEELLPALARYINKLPQVPHEKVLEYICKVLFRDNSQLELLKIVYNSYLIHSVPGIVHTLNTEGSSFLQSLAKKNLSESRSQQRLTLSTSGKWEVVVQSSLQIRYWFEVDSLSRWCLTAFWVMENDFTPLEICVPQRKTRSQLLKFIRLYTLFYMTWYIRPISPSISSTFCQTGSNRWNWSKNLPRQQLLHWFRTSIPEVQISGTERVENCTG